MLVSDWKHQPFLNKSAEKQPIFSKAPLRGGSIYRVSQLALEGHGRQEVHLCTPLARGPSPAAPQRPYLRPSSELYPPEEAREYRPVSDITILRSIYLYM